MKRKLLFGVALGFASIFTPSCSLLPRFEASAVAPAPKDARRVEVQEKSSDGKVRVIPPALGQASIAPQAPGVSLEVAATLVGSGSVSATIVPQPVPEFIDTVFGGILGLRYVTGPGVANRTDFVALRSPSAIPRANFFVMAQMALAEQGLTVAIENDTVVVSEVETEAGSGPLLTRIPPSSSAVGRNVTQIIELAAIDAKTISGLINDTFGGDRGARIEVREDTNSLVVTGQPRQVARVASLVNRLDTPRFGQGMLARVQPEYWSADQLSTALAEVMSKEGYRVSAGEQTATSALVLFPVPSTNSFLIFSNNKIAFDRSLYWVRELDQASAFGDQQGVFVYQVENTSAAELGALIANAFEAGASNTSGQVAAPSQRRVTMRDPNSARDVRSEGATNIANQTVARVGDKITVDAGGNRILFRGTAGEFAQVRALLSQLDTPPRQVLVEMTIAEVTLTDETRFGIEWFLRERVGAGILTADTRGGSERAPGGLGALFSRTYGRGQLDTLLNAIATNRNINILSTPRILSRSGGVAEILVGTDVPIITSQRAAGTQVGGSTDVLQTVQYRQTGIILNVRPVVYGDDRVSIEIYQEVSSQEPNRTSAISSPIIQNRSVSTQLALREGMTAVIGGLLQDNFSREQRGLPILKDIPLIGPAFRADAVGGGKVELLILLTPYVLQDDGDLASATSSLIDDINRSMAVRGTQVYTLLPVSLPWAPATSSRGPRAPNTESGARDGAGRTHK